MKKYRINYKNGINEEVEVESVTLIREEEYPLYLHELVEGERYENQNGSIITVKGSFLYSSGGGIILACVAARFKLLPKKKTCGKCKECTHLFDFKAKNEQKN